MFKSSLSQKTRQQLDATLEQLNKMRDELNRHDGFQNLKLQQISNEPLSQLAYKDFIVYYQQIAQVLKTLQLNKDNIDKNYPAIKLSLDKLKEKKYVPSSQKGRELSEMESSFQDLILSYENRNQYVKNLVKSTRSDYHNYSINDINKVMGEINSYLVEQKKVYNQAKILLENIVKLKSPILQQLVQTNVVKLPHDIDAKKVEAINSITDTIYNAPSDLLEAIEKYNIALTLEQCERINQEAISIYVKNSKQERAEIEKQLQKVDVLLDSLKNWKDIKENSDLLEVDNLLDDRSEEEQINIIEESSAPIDENVNTAPIVENIDTAESLIIEIKKSFYEQQVRNKEVNEESRQLRHDLLDFMGNEENTFVGEIEIKKQFEQLINDLNHDVTQFERMYQNNRIQLLSDTNTWSAVFERISDASELLKINDYKLELQKIIEQLQEKQQSLNNNIDPLSKGKLNVIQRYLQSTQTLLVKVNNLEQIIQEDIDDAEKKSDKYINESRDIPDITEILPPSIVELENAHSVEAVMQRWLNKSLIYKNEGSENWSKKDSEKYQYNIAILDDTDNDLVGTNNKLEVRTFNNNSYYGFQTEDLVQRLESVHATAMSLVPRNIEHRQELLHWMEQCQKAVAKQIMQACQFTIDATSDDDIQKIIDHGKELIGQYLVDVVHAIMPETPIEEALKKVRKAEGGVVAKNGRSNFIHLYDVDSVQAIQRFSAAQTIGKETIPSTVRDRPQLVNFMRMACGYRDESNHLNVDFVGYRHSSYPLIQIESENLTDKLTRRQGAVTAVMEMLTELAKQKLQGKNASDYTENPLTVSLSTLALFTPLRLHTGREGEERQLKETQLALKMLHNQVLDLTVIIDQQAVKVKIRPNCTLMNGPSNVLTRFTVFDNLQKQVNAQGFYELTNNVDSYLQENLSEKLQVFDEVTNRKIKDIASDWNKIDQLYLKNNSLKQKETILQEKIKEQNLDADYHNLHQLQQNALSSEEPLRGQYQRQYQELYESINKKLEIISLYYKDYNASRSTVYYDNITSIRNLQQQIIELLANKENNIWLSTSEGQQLQKIYNTMQLYMDAQSLFFSDKISSNKRIHDFNVRYALLNYKIGRDLESFCKSGEDRTGRLFNRIEEYQIFHQENGFYPRYRNKADTKRLEEIALTVFAFAGSREIAGKNAPGARGLQQSESLLVNQGLPVSVDHKIATTAKKVYQPEKTKFKRVFDRDLRMSQFRQKSQEALAESIIVNSTTFAFVGELQEYALNQLDLSELLNYLKIDNGEYKAEEWNFKNAAEVLDAAIGYGYLKSQADRQSELAKKHSGLQVVLTHYLHEQLRLNEDSKLSTDIHRFALIYDVMLNTLSELDSDLVRLQQSLQDEQFGNHVEMSVANRLNSRISTTYNMMLEEYKRCEKICVNEEDTKNSELMLIIKRQRSEVLKEHEQARDTLLQIDTRVRLYELLQDTDGKIIRHGKSIATDFGVEISPFIKKSENESEFLRATHDKATLRNILQLERKKLDYYEPDAALLEQLKVSEWSKRILETPLGLGLSKKYKKLLEDQRKVQEFFENYHKLEKLVEAGAIQHLAKFNQFFNDPKTRVAQEISAYAKNKIVDLKRNIAKSILNEISIKQTVASIIHFDRLLQSAIDEKQLLNIKGYSNRNVTPALVAYSEGFSKVSQYVAASILASDDIDLRAIQLEYWLRVAEQCYSMGNYSSVKAIIAGGIQANGIDSDSTLLNALSDQGKLIFAKLNAESDDHSLLYASEHKQGALLPYVGNMMTMLTTTAENKGLLQESPVAKRMLNILQQTKLYMKEYDWVDDAKNNELSNALLNYQWSEDKAVELTRRVTTLKNNTQSGQLRLNKLNLSGGGISDVISKYQHIYQEANHLFEKQALYLTQEETYRQSINRIDISTLDEQLSMEIDSDIKFDEKMELSEAVNQLIDELDTHIVETTEKTLHAHANRLDRIIENMQSLQSGSVAAYSREQLQRTFKDFKKLEIKYKADDGFGKALKEFNGFALERRSKLKGYQKKLAEQIDKAKIKFNEEPLLRSQALDLLQDASRVDKICQLIISRSTAVTVTSSLIAFNCQLAAEDVSSLKKHRVPDCINATIYDNHSNSEDSIQINQKLQQQVAELIKFYNVDDYRGHKLSEYINNIGENDERNVNRKALVEKLAVLEKSLQMQNQELMSLRNRTNSQFTPENIDIMQEKFHDSVYATFKQKKFKASGLISGELLSKAAKDLSKNEVEQLQQLRNQFLVIKQISIPAIEQKKNWMKAGPNNQKKLLKLNSLIANNVQNGVFHQAYQTLNSNLDSRIKAMNESQQQLTEQQQILKSAINELSVIDDLANHFNKCLTLQQTYLQLNESVMQLMQELNAQSVTAKQMGYLQDESLFKPMFEELSSIDTRLSNDNQSSREMLLILEQLRFKQLESQPLIKLRIPLFLNPAMRSALLANKIAAYELLDEKFDQNKVIALNTLSIRSKEELQLQLTGLGMTSLTELQLNDVVQNQSQLDLLWQLDNAALREALLKNPDKVDLNNLQKADLLILNDYTQIDRAVALLNNKNIAALDDNILSTIKAGYRRLAISKQIKNAYLRKLIAEDQRVQLPDNVTQEQINAVNKATTEVVSRVNFQRSALEIIGSINCFEPNPWQSILQHRTDNGVIDNQLDKIITENHRLNFINKIKLPILRDILCENLNAKLHVRDKEQFTTISLAGLELINDLDSYKNMSPNDFQQKFAGVLDGYIPDGQLFQRCQQQANSMTALRQLNTHYSTIDDDVTELAGQTDEQQIRWLQLQLDSKGDALLQSYNQYTANDQPSGKIYALSSLANQLHSLDAQLYEFNDLREIHQKLLIHKKNLSPDLNESMIQTLAIELSIDPEILIEQRQQQLEKVDSALLKNDELMQQQHKVINKRYEILAMLYPQLAQDSVIIAEFFGESISGNLSNISAMILQRVRQMRSNMSETERKQRNQSALKALLPGLSYLYADEQRRHSVLLTTQEQSSLSQLYAIIEKQNRHLIPDSDQSHEIEILGEHNFASPLSHIAPTPRNEIPTPYFHEQYADSSSVGLSLTDETDAPTNTFYEQNEEDEAATSSRSVTSVPRRLTANEPTSEESAHTSMQTLKQNYRDLAANIKCRSNSISYRSPIYNQSFSQRIANPLYTREKSFIVDAVATLINQRPQAKLYSAIFIGGKYKILIDQAYVVTKALGLEARFEPGVKVNDNEHIQLLIEEYKQRSDIQLLKERLFNRPDQSEETDLQLSNHLRE